MGEHTPIIKDPLQRPQKGPGVWLSGRMLTQHVQGPSSMPGIEGGEAKVSTDEATPSLQMYLVLRAPTQAQCPCSAPSIPR
jgi:hypothetical protein